MAPQVFMNYIHSSSLLNQLSSLWKCDQLCDAVITVDNCIVAKAHKLVLLAISPKLKNDSENASQNTSILDVSLPSGVHHKAVHALLQYLYEGFLIITEDIAKDLMEIAEFLEIKCLFKCCHEFCLKSFKDTPQISENSFWLNTNNEDYSHVRKSMYESHPVENRKRRRSFESGGENCKRKSKEDLSKSATANVSYNEQLGDDDIHNASSSCEEGGTNRKSPPQQKSFERNRQILDPSQGDSQDSVEDEVDHFKGQISHVGRTLIQDSKSNSSNPKHITNFTKHRLLSIKQEAAFESCQDSSGQTVFDTSVSAPFDAGGDQDDHDLLCKMKVEPASDDSSDCQLVEFSEGSYVSPSHNTKDKHFYINRVPSATDGSYCTPSGQISRKLSRNPSSGTSNCSSVHSSRDIYPGDMPSSDFSVSQMALGQEIGEDEDQVDTPIMNFGSDTQYHADSDQTSTPQAQKQGPFSTEQYQYASVVTPRVFTCMVCGTSFSQRSNLTRHHRIHTEERPHVCNVCGKCFRRSDYLQTHELSIHGGVITRKNRRYNDNI